MNRRGAWKIGRKIRSSTPTEVRIPARLMFWLSWKEFPASPKASSFAGPTVAKTYSAFTTKYLLAPRERPSSAVKILWGLVGGIPETGPVSAKALLAAQLEPLVDR